MTNYFVTVFLSDRAYGGPEEGGWWYDCGERLKDRRVFVFQNEDDAIAFSRRYNERLAKWPNKNRRDINSVLSEGVYTAEIFEDSLPDYYPTQRPHYE